MSADEYGLREGEVAVDLPEAFDSGIYFIGEIGTPWKSRADCPKNPGESDAICTIRLDPRYAAAAQDLETCSQLSSWLFIFMNRGGARIFVSPGSPRHFNSTGTPRVFALRSTGRGQSDRAGRGACIEYPLEGNNLCACSGLVLSRRHATRCDI